MLTRLIRPGLLGALLAAPVQNPANPPVQTPPTAAISGVVVDGTTNAPIAGAVVSITKGRDQIGPQTRQLTDARGRYAFTNLPAGDNYALTASKFGYFDGAYGRDAASNAPAAQLSLSDGQWVGNARIVLWRPAAVGGTVTDERGEPIVGVYVRALAQRRLAGQSHLVAGPSTMTDDRGRYRISGLRPGRFFLSVPSVQWSVPASMTPATIAGFSEELAATREVPVETALDLSASTRLVLGNFPVPPPAVDGRALTYPIAFHPAAASIAEATAVDLKDGEERDNVDIRLDPVPAATVSGKVQGPPEALVNLSLRLMPAGLEELGLGSEGATTMVATDGSFVFLNVPAGSYTVDVMRGLSEFTERAGSGSPIESNRSQEFPPRAPGTMGSGWSSESLPSGPAGSTFLTRSSYASGQFKNALTGRTTVTVTGRDVANVAVVLRGAGSIHGRVVIDIDPRQKSESRPAYLPIRAEPADGDPRLGLPRVEGPTTNPQSDAFEIFGLQPGRYLLRANLPAPWAIKSIVVNGKDVTETPIDAANGESFSNVVLTITNAGATINGAITDGQGQPSAGAAVLMFPTDPAAWTDFGLWPPRIRTTSASNTGAFTFAARPAGDYYVIALPAADIDAWQAPDFFKKAAPRATRVTVGWGETKTLDLRLMEIR